MFYHSIKQGPSSATTKDCLVLKDDDVTHTAIEAKNCLVNMINHSLIDIETTADSKVYLDLAESGTNQYTDRACTNFVCNFDNHNPPQDDFIVPVTNQHTSRASTNKFVCNFYNHNQPQILICLIIFLFLLHLII